MQAQLLTYAAFGRGALVGGAFGRIGGRNKPGCAVRVVQRTRDWRTRKTAQQDRARALIVTGRDQEEDV